MAHSRKRRLVAALVSAATVFVVFVGSTSAKVIFEEQFHDEGTFVETSFCGVPGLLINGSFVADGRVKAVPHGSEGLAYFAEHITASTTLTNPANGITIHDSVRVVQKDLKVTDNGDGTLTILVLATGNATLYGPDGKAIARNPGQIRFEILIDHNGTPADPSDDVFLEDLGQVKGSTGRSDDFCAAAVDALT